VLFINSCSRSFVFNGVLDKSFLFWDYNYNFEPHLESLPARCHRYDDGLELLKHQAIEALRFWNFSA